MSISSSNFGPFTSLVATAGSIVAMGAAIALGWRRRAKWEPSEEDVSRGPQRVGALVAAIGIVLIWANSRPDQVAALSRYAIVLLAMTVVALLVYGLLNSTLVYYIEVAVTSQTTEKKNFIAGFWYRKGIPERIAMSGVTTQEFLKGVIYKVDVVWSRFSRGLAKQTFVVAYLLLTVCGSLALAVGAIITGFKTGH